MTENSRFWDGTTVGDATEAPYNAPDEFAAVLRSINGANANTSRSGVCRGELNLLACTGAASPISVNTGRAFVHGSWYESDAVTSFNIASPPPTQSRIDTLVLRKTWSTQQVRLAVLTGTNAVVPSAPTITQDATVTKIWEFPLYDIYINSAGVITSLVDRREYVPYLSIQSFYKIDEVTLVAPASVVSLAVGSVAFKKYVLSIRARADLVAMSTASPLMVYFNADLTNYYSSYLTNSGGLPALVEALSTWAIEVGYIQSSGVAGEITDSFIVMSDLRASERKHISFLTSGFDLMGFRTYVGGGCYNRTPFSAIPTVNIAINHASKQFQIGGVFTLYGIV